MYQITPDDLLKLRYLDCINKVMWTFKLHDRVTFNGSGKIENGVWDMLFNHDSQIGSILHDLCHFAEQEKERVGKWTFGPRMYSFKTMQPLEREIRVVAYQYNLYKYAEFSTASIKECIAQLEILYPKNISFEEHLAIPDIISSKLEKAVEIYTVEKFCHDFSENMNLLRA